MPGVENNEVGGRGRSSKKALSSSDSGNTRGKSGNSKTNKNERGDAYFGLTLAGTEVQAYST